MTSLDDLRVALPITGLAVYAYETNGPVTLELLFHNNGTMVYVGPDVRDVVDQAVRDFGFSVAAPTAEEPTEPAVEEEEDIFA